MEGRGFARSFERGQIHDGRYMSTMHPDHTGKGIQAAFMENLVDLFVETDCESLVGSAVSFYAQKI